MQDTEPERVASLSHEVIHGFFEVYEPLAAQFTADRILKVDETGLLGTGRQAKGVAERAGVTAVRRVNMISNKRNSFTMVSAITPQAVLPPYFIFKGQCVMVDPLQYIDEVIPGMCSSSHVHACQILASEMLESVMRTKVQGIPSSFAGDLSFACI